MVSKREKYLIGGMLMVGGLVGIGGYLVWPTITAITTNFQKKGQYELETASLKAQVAANQQSVLQLKQVKALPPGVTLRGYQPEALQLNIKAMLDEIMRLAATHGNDLIVLEPWDANEATAAPPPPPAKPAGAGGEAATAPPAEEPINLTTFGYSLTLRGSYDSILGFFAALNDHGELVEMRDIKLENEAGENRTKTDAPVANPMKPIKLTARLALYLQPQ